MLQSIFSEYVEKYFRLIVGKITEKFNDKKNETTMLHKTMLTEEYSADMTWEGTTINHFIVAADVVSMDSSLPLKKRGSMQRAGGKLPKLGIKYRKGEKDVSDINVMIARGTDEATVVAKLFDDAGKAVRGIDVRTEIMFEEGLSTGYAIVEGEDNDGTGIRVNYGYKSDNTFHALTAEWSSNEATPVKDIQQMFDKAQLDGNSIAHIWLSRKAFNEIRYSTEGKELAARFLNVLFTENTNLPTPSRATMLDALRDEFGAEFHIIDSAFRIQKPDGTYKTVKPFDEDNVIGTPSENVGRLVYGTLVEETNPVNAVDYVKSGSHILVSKYSTNDPFAEMTAAQAICLPVIDDVDGIYILKTGGTGVLSVDKSSVFFHNEADSTGVKVKVYAENSYTVSQTASTSWLTVTKSADGETLTLTVGANATGSARTSTVTLTDSESNTVTIAVTQAAAISVSPNSLTFTKNGSTSGKKFTVSSDSDFEATTSVSWLTLIKNGNDVVVTCEANDATSAPERTATITVTSGDGETATVSVTQAANA